MDNLADIKKYSPNADEGVVAKMEKTYRLVLSKVDSRQVSESDPTELATVRENFVKKKLGVKATDEAIDADVAAVCKQIEGRNNRLTVYYLLAEKYGKLDVFKA